MPLITNNTNHTPLGGNPLHTVVRRGLGKRPAAEFPLPLSRPVEIHVDQIHKTQKKWNGAGTFGLLATLKKMNDVKNAAEGLRGLSGRTEYD